MQKWEYCTITRYIGELPTLVRDLAKQWQFDLDAHPRQAVVVTREGADEWPILFDDVLVALNCYGQSGWEVAGVTSLSRQDEQEVRSVATEYVLKRPTRASGDVSP